MIKRNVFCKKCVRILCSLCAKENPVLPMEWSYEMKTSEVGVKRGK